MRKLATIRNFVKQTNLFAHHKILYFSFTHFPSKYTLGEIVNNVFTVRVKFAAVLNDFYSQIRWYIKNQSNRLVGLPCDHFTNIG